MKTVLNRTTTTNVTIAANGNGNSAIKTSPALRRFAMKLLLGVFVVLACVQKSEGQSVYTEDFGNTTSITLPYSFGTNATGNASKNANLGTPSWNQNLTNAQFAGNTLGAMSATTGVNTYTITCTFTVNSGYKLNPTSIGFDNRGSSTGPTSLAIAISGTGGSTSCSPTPSRTGAFTTTAATNFASTTQYLTGTVTLTFTFTGGAASSTERLDNVILNGTLCQLPSISAGGQPLATQTVCQNNTPANLTVTATGTSLSYAWFSSTDNSNLTSGDDLPVGTNSATYTPLTNTVGTLYYYCLITNPCLVGNVPSLPGEVIVSACPPPANDNCANAISLPVSGSCVTTSGTTVNATQSIAASLCGGASDDDVWYSFVANNTTATITVAGGAGFVASAELLGGACNGTALFCSNAAGPGGSATINATGLGIGNTYLIRIYSFGSGAATTGTFTVCVNSTCLAPAQQTVSGGGTRCGNGPALSVTLGGSEASFSYQLIRNGNPVAGALMAGTGNSLVFSPITVAGTYTVNAVNLGNINCATPMTGSAIVIVNSPAPPTGDANQSFCSAASPTVSSLTAAVSGTTIKWYNDPSTGTAYTGTEPLVDGQHYYASQTVSGCESVSRLDVTANVTTTPSSSTITVTNSTCQPGCTVGGGSFNITPCAGSTMTFYTDNIGSNPTTVAPVYNQTTAMTIYYACVNGNCRSAIQTLTTVPGTCVTPTCPSSFSVCSNAGPVTLSGSTPGGGVYSGPGVSAGVFDPSSGSGPHLITYTLGNCSCSFTITVVPAAVANSGTNSNTTICSGDSYAVTGGSVSNAASYTWTTGGDGTFTPNDNSSLNPTYTPGATDISSGVVTITLTAIGNAPCGVATDTKTLHITTVAAPACPAHMNVCVNASPFALAGHGENPSGGTFSGPGVSGGIFTPSAAGVGTHTIVYTVTVGACSNTCSFTITVTNPVAPAGVYRSKADGNWSNSATWEVSDGCNWATAATSPQTGSDVVIRNSVTLDVPSASVDDLIFSSNLPTRPDGITFSVVAVGARLFLVNNNISANTVTGNNSLGYVVTNGTGTLSVPVGAGNAKTFPVGSSATSYDAVSLTPTSAATFAVSVKAIATAADFDDGASTVNNFALVAHRQWSISPTSGVPGSTNLSLTDGGATFNPSAPIVIGHYSGGTWTELPATFNPYTYSGTVSSFSPFGAGSGGGFAPLAATDYYVNDNSTVGDINGGTVGNDANPGTAALPFLTIGHAISVASAGSTIHVDAGTYAESTGPDKQLTILGANATISPNGGVRNAESIMTSPQAFRPVTTSAVAIKGFKFTTTSGNPVDCYTTDANITLDKNLFDATYGMFFANSATLTITDNKFNNLDPAYEGLFIAGNYNGSTGTYADIHDNTWTASATTGMNLSSVHGIFYHNNLTSQTYYGMLVANKCSLDIYENTFTGTIDPGGSPTYGAAIRFYTPQPGMIANIHNNFFTNNAYGVAIRNVGGDGSLAGTTVTIVNNSFSGSTNKNIKNTAAETLTATCNWFGSNDLATVTATMDQAPGAIVFVPYLSSGVDAGGNPADGFQPSVSCVPSCSLVASASSTDATCPTSTNGTATATVVSGGTAPYSYLWSNGQTTATAINLAAGPYSVTISDATGCSTSASTTVNNSTAGPVHNISSGLNYCTIQSAVNAATPGDLIVADAGIYTESVTINKAITLKGAQAGIDPRPYVASARIAGDPTESIIQQPKSASVINITAGAVIIDGFDLRHVGGSGAADLIASPATPLKTGLSIVNNIFTDAADEGAEIKGFSNATIQRNYTFNTTGDGFNFSDNPTSSNLKIINNQIVNSQSTNGAIYIYNINDVLVQSNIITNPKSGAIRVSLSTGSLPATNITISNNDISGVFASGSGSEWAVSVQGPASGPSFSNNITVKNNTIVQTGGVATSAFVLFNSYGNVTNLAFNNNYMDRSPGSSSTNFYVRFGNTSNAFSPVQPIDATCNWFGSNNMATVLSRVVNQGVHKVVPYLSSGVDADGGAIGFVPAGTCIGPVHDVTQNTYFSAIQPAIDAAVANDVIEAAAGTYNESLNINKTLTLKGAQADVCAAARSGAETIINCVNGIGVNASNVIINGFTIQGQTSAAAPGFGYAVYMVPTNTGTHLINNIIKNNVVGSSISNAGASPAQVLISCNWFDSNNQPGAASGSGIYTDQFTGGGVISNVLIDNNKFTANADAGIDFSVSTAATAATGITMSNNLFDNNRRAAFLYNVVSSSFSSNEVSNSTGAGTGEVRVYGGVNNFSITNNKFFAGAPFGVFISNDGGINSSAINVNDNSFTGYSNTVYAINNASGYTGSVAATCNWYGVTGAAVTPLINGNVTYVPFRTSGADGSPAIGFQPSAPCSACPTLSTSATPVSACGTADGTASVTVTGGSGTVTYSWAPGGQTTATATGLAAGTYTVTVTDDNGCVQTATATVTSPPGTSTIAFTAKNTTTGLGGSTAGPGSTVTVNFCAGQFFQFSGFSSSTPGQVGVIEEIATGTNNVLYAGSPVNVPRPQTNIAPAAMAGYFSGTYGSYTLSSGTTGSLTQTYTPYLDVNNNGVYDAGVDCLGQAVTLQYNISLGPIENTNDGLFFCTIQEAINASTTSAGENIHVPAGTYNETVVVNKGVRIFGDGYSTKIIPVLPNDNTMTIAANGVTLENMHLEGLFIAGSSSTRGIYFSNAGAVANTTITGVKSSLHQYAMYAPNGSDVSNLTVTNSEFLASGNGFSVDVSAKVNGVTVTGSKFDSNNFGFSSNANSAATNNQTGLNNVRVSSSTFNNNSLKGLYFEKLNDAEFDNITVDNSGNAAASIQNSGFDVNLKFGTYTHFRLTNSTITNNGQVDPNGAGLLIKARTVGGAGLYSSNPATLSDVLISHNFFNNNGGPTYGAGLRVGDANNSLFGVEAGPAGVEIHENSFTGNSVHAIRNASTASVNATCNWFDATSAATVDSRIGYDGTHVVNYIPWLMNGTDNNGAAPGFYAVPGSCTGVPTDLYVNDNSNVGDHYTTALGNDANPGTPAAPFLTIQHAISVASAGNTIWVDAGTYALTTAAGVNKKLTINGSRMGLDGRVATAVAASIVDASAVPAYPGTAFDVQPTGSESVLDGFTIQGATGNGGIWLEAGTNGSTVQNNIMQGNVVGLFLANNSAVKQTLITKNLFQNNTVAGPSSGHGIYADNFTAGATLQNVLITDNKFTNAVTVVDSWALGLGNVGPNPWTTVTFQNNEVTNSGRGVYLYGTTNSTISGNSISGVTNYAVGIFDGGGAANASLTVTGNTFTNDFRGIYLSKNTIDAYTGTLSPTGNTFTGGTYDMVNEAFAGGTSTIIDAVNNTYDGVLLDGSTSLTDIFTIADKVLDAVDVTDFGKINLRTANQYVTVNSFSVADGTTEADIQRAVNAASAVNTVHVAPGTFNDNVNVNKQLIIEGQGQGVTIVRPSVSNPSAGGSLGSVVFKVQANSVTIHDLTVNGNNPALGAGIHASSGIITDWNADYTNLEVHHVTVQDVYLRGIEAANNASNTNTFNFHDNIVSGVNSDAASIAIFNYGDAGQIMNNTVSNSNGGIQANYSLGTTISGNTVTGISNSTGIESDNSGGAGGTADVISNNTISGGSYGVFVFHPTLTVSVNANDVSNYATTGVTVAGRDGTGSANITSNDINGSGNAGASGIVISSSDFGFGTMDADATASNNYVRNNGIDGFRLETETGKTTSLVAHNNSITNNTNKNAEITGAGTGTADMTCNWWGGIAAGAIGASISGPVTYSPYLTSGTDDQPGTIGFQTSAACTTVNDLYVNDGSFSGGDYTTAAGNDANLGTSSSPFATIQHAVDVAAPGNTIWVDAGSYFEDVVVNKGVTIKGRNAGLDPGCNGSGHTFAESVVYPVSNINDPSNPSYTKVIKITADNVVIDGLYVNGDNPSQSGQYNAAVGIAANSGQAGLDIKNNIVQNLPYIGIDLSNDAGVMSGNNQIHNNRLFDMSPASGFGIAVYTGNNTYSDIKDNCMSNVRKGIQGGENNYLANIGNVSPVWSGNKIESYKIGIWNNLAYGTATPVTITGNTMTTVSGSTINSGIEISSLQGTASVTITGNTVTAAMAGINLWNNPTSNTVTVGANTFTNCVNGVFANNYDGFNSNADPSAYIIDGATINGGTNGVYVKDNNLNSNGATVSVQIKNNTAISGSTTGLKIEGGDASASFTGATPATFTGNTVYIDQVTNGSNVPATNMDATAVVFDGSTGAGKTLAQNFATEDKIVHKVDYAALGFVLVKAGEDFVTINSFDAPATTTPLIQRGVDAASAGFTVNVGPGTFTEQVEVPKDLTVWGQGIGVTTIVSPASLPLSYVTSAVNKPIVYIHDANVTFKGFTVDGAGQGNANFRFQGIAYRNAGGLARDNEVKAIRETPLSGTQHGNAVYALADNGTNRALSLLNNTITDFQKNGIVASGANLTATIDGNTVTGAGPTTLIAQNGIQISTGATGSVTNNTVSSMAYTPNSVTACGVLIFGATGSVNTSNNIINNCQAGVYYYQSGGTITENTISYPSMGATPYWWGIDVENGATQVLRNTINAGNNGVGIEADAVSGETTTMTAANNFVNNTDEGVVIYQDGSGSVTTQVHENSILGNLTKAIHNYGAALQDATCNWYGTTNTGVIASKIAGSVTYVPYLNNGTDFAPATPGFQPVPGSCVCPAITISVVPHNVTCLGTNTGKLDITGGGGPGPYTYSWTGPVTGSIASIPSGFTYTVNTLPAGTYTVTVTNAAGCSNSTTVVIAAPAAALTLSLSSTNATCFNANNGTMTFTIAGGWYPNYSLVWSGDGTGGVGTFPGPGTYGPVTNLLPAVYTATVTDANGCIVTATTTITQPTLLTATITGQTNVSCNGGSNGSATVTAGGGTSPYSYSWNTVPVQTGITATGLTAGTYTVTVTDAHGCTTTASATITEPSALTATTTQTNVSCNGGSNGTATAVPAGGTSPYSYSWNTVPVQTGITATGLTAGTYTVTVTDAHGCTTTASATITEPSALTATTTQTNVSCNGGSNGTATAVPAGGTSPYSYSWNTVPVQTGITATGLAPGTYTVTVTDAHGCTTTASATITEPSALTATTTQTNVSCNGAANGTATAVPAGGTSPYSYSWNTVPVQTGITATGLTAGTYTVTVTDAHGCTTTASATITEPSALTATTTQTNVSCNGGSNGTATAVPAGGTSPYSYSWNTVPVQTGITATGLTAGTYTVTVTDAHGCTTTASATITEPSALTATTTQTNVSCNGGSNGTATAVPAGGTSPYSYSWNTVPVQTGITATGLTAGTYTVTVTDAHGCTTTASATITEPSALTATTTQTNVSCNGAANGTATAVPGGGTSPYSYSWNTVPVQTGITATGLAPGTYTVTVTDAHGCTTTASATITEPSALTATTTQTNVSCNGGSNGTATAVPAGGTSPYSYSWNTVPVQTGITATGLTAGTYTVTVTDAHGCTTTASATITEPSALTATTTQTNVSCNGGSNGTATAVPAGGTSPYSYSWNTVPVQTGITATGLTAGTYTVTVTDAHGCTTTASATITEPSALTATTTQTNVSCNGGSNGTATAVPAGGTSPYSYSWNTVPVQTGITATGLTAGTYTVTVTDAHGCTTTASATITQPAAISAGITSAIVTNVNCFGNMNGSIDISISSSGGTGALTPGYVWTASNGGVVPAGQVNNQDLTGLMPGDYTVVVTITDANGCTGTATATYTITQPGDINATVVASGTNVTCNGGNNGTATVSVTGLSGGPAAGSYTLAYVWTATGGGVVPAGQTNNQSLTGLVAGTYTVAVQVTKGGCTKMFTSQYIVTQPGVLTVTPSQTNVTCAGGSNGSITLVASGGTAPYTFTLTGPGGPYPPNNTGVFPGLVAGTYSYSVTDAPNCGAPVTGTVVITESQHSDMSLGSDIGDSFFTNGTSQTVVYNLVEIGGKTVNQPITLHITKNFGYTYNYNNAITSVTLHGFINYSLDNPNWTVTANNPFYLELTTNYSVFLCNRGPVNVALTVTRSTTGGSTQNMNGSILVVPTEISVLNNNNSILLTSQ